MTPLKCPSCGFDSPEEAAWCDLCKHPFRKPERPVPPKEPPRPGPPAAPSSLLEGLPEEVRAKVPPHLQPEPGERMPAVSREVRWLAWAFLSFWVILGMTLAGLLWGRKTALEAGDAPPPVPSEPRIP